jgi:hypothetical protein
MIDYDIPEKAWREYVKVDRVLAVEADRTGVINTLNGPVWYSKGDYILTDNPPTHTWPVKRDIFKRTYQLVRSQWGG